MWETSFSHSSAAPIPPNMLIENAISILHDFETVMKFSPDCRGCRPVQPKNGHAKTNGAENSGQLQFYEVEQDLPFIPKRIWSGGVTYSSEFLPLPDGCDITIHAPGGFNSTNHWRLIRDHVPDNEETGGLERVRSKDMLHAGTAGSGWYVQIVSDASCSKTYASFVKGFLKNSHSQLQQQFIERLKSSNEQQQGRQRPTMGRRMSSVL